MASGKSISGYYLPNSHDKLTKIKIMSSWIESVRTLLRITHLAFRKSYLAIVSPNAHANLTKIKIRSSWSRLIKIRSSWSRSNYYLRSLLNPQEIHRT